MSNHETFKFEVPPASEDTKAPGLLAGVGAGGFMDTQKAVRGALTHTTLRLSLSLPAVGSTTANDAFHVLRRRRCSCSR